MATMLEQNVSPRATSIVSTLALLFFLPMIGLAFYSTWNLITRAFGTPANIIVDTKTILEPVNVDFMRAFAQGGEETGDMLASIIPEVKALRPRLIRLDHIYDYHHVVERSGDSLSFHWESLDRAVQSILATGAKPVLSLSYMPPAIAQGGVVINPPNNWDEWSQVIQATIEHYSGRGNKNISGVYYEVWNEPDLPQFGGWKLSGEKNYLTLYRYAAIGARKAKNTQQFFFGGPATTGLYQNWIISLAASGNRLDFLSWHTYLADPKRYTRDQQNIATWLLPYPQYVLLPKLITEFGFTGAKDARYSGNYAAAHTAAVIKELAVGGPSYLFSFELKDGPGDTTQGWGLLSHQTKGKKPRSRYFVYNFLSDISGNRVFHSGDGTWVSALATTKNNATRILLVNFHPSSSKSENVPVTFTNLDPGAYTYREKLLQGRNVTFTETVRDDGILSKEVFLPANAVAILELTPASPATPSAN